MNQVPNVHIYVGLVDNLIEIYGQDISMLPSHRQDAIDRCKNESDWRRSLAVSHLYVQAMKEQGLDPHMPVFFSESGKMYLGNKEDMTCETRDGEARNDEASDDSAKDGEARDDDASDDQARDVISYVNLSHGGNFVACAIANREVGVDVEGVRPCKEAVLRRFLKRSEGEENCGDKEVVSKDFFASEIMDILQMKEGKEKDRAFSSLWTKLESQVKLDGRGIGALMLVESKDIDTRSFEPYNDCFVSVSVYSQSEPQISLHKLTQ